MKLTNMKVEPKADKACDPCMVSPSGEGPRYPYGLCLHLDNETLEKLGLSDLPKIGSKLKLEAVVEVNGISANKSGSGENYKSLSLQITDMAVGAEKKAVEGKDFYKD